MNRSSMVPENATYYGQEQRVDQSGNQNYERPATYRTLRVYGKEIKEIQYGNYGDRQIAALRLEDGSVISAQDVAEAYQRNQTEGIQVVAGSTTDSLVIKSVRGYAKTPLSALPRFY